MEILHTQLTITHSTLVVSIALGAERWVTWGQWCADSICEFSWYKYPHYGWFQSTNMISAVSWLQNFWKSHDHLWEPVQTSSTTPLPEANGWNEKCPRLWSRSSGSRASSMELDSLHHPHELTFPTLNLNFPSCQMEIINLALPA